MNPYDVLKISRQSTKEEARIAYRRLASVHHPDKGGDTEVFKDIQLAWEAIDAGFTTPVEPPKPRYSAQSSSFTKPESVWRGKQSDDEPFDPFRHHRPHGTSHKKQSPRAAPIFKQSVVQAWRTEKSQQKTLGNFTARVSMAEAYNGFILEIDVQGVKRQVQMPRGMPHGLKNTIKIAGSNEILTVTTLFTQSAYEFKSAENITPEIVMISGTPVSVYRVGELKYYHTMHVRDLRGNRSIELEDFLGKKYKVQLPYDVIDRRAPIRVPNMGYVDWCSTTSEPNDIRGDVLVYIIPTEIVPPTNMSW